MVQPVSAQVTPVKFNSIAYGSFRMRMSSEDIVDSLYTSPRLHTVF